MNLEGCTRPAIAAIATMLMLAATTVSDARAQEGDVAGPVDRSIDAIIIEADELIAAGDHEAAIELLEEGLESAQPGDREGRASLHGRLAIGHFYRRDTERIREHAEIAIDLVADDPEALDVYADALGARALYLAESGQSDAYLKASETELAVRRQLPVAESEISSPLINIAIAHGERGDYQVAERYLREALDYALQYESDTTRPTTIRTNLAWVYGMRKDYRESARMLRAVIETGREKAPGSVNLAIRLANLGSILRSLERYDEAREALAEALSLQRSQIPGSVDLARTTFALAQVTEAQGDDTRAEALYREALEIIDSHTPDSPGAAFPRRALASLLIDRGELEPARTLLEQALALTSRMKAPGQHAATLFQMGRIEYESGDTGAARNRWREAVDALEIQYDLLGGSALTMASFSAAYEPLYRRYSQLLIDEGEYLEAIRLLESYRNRALLERLDVGGILRRSMAGQRLLADLQDLGRQARKLSETDDTAKTPGQRLAELRRERQARIAAAVEADPGLAELVEGTPVLRAKDLEPGQRGRILYFSLGEKRSDLLVVGPDGITAHALPPETEIASLIERFRILVQRPEADPGPLAEVAGRLYESLLAPAADRIADAESLQVRADGPLLLLPFSALRDADGRYLVERHRIRNLYTLKRGRTGASGPERKDTEYADFAGFAYAGEADGGPGQRSDRGPLRFVSEEVERAAAVFGDGARRHFGPAATETRARQTQGSRILHFASHAVADPVQPLSSYISLAADEDNDGRMKLWEIMADLRLDAGLVVLSACETALGPSFAGEGLFGLAKGFAFAGAESVMASLWAIDDASTMYLTEAFYRELTAGRTPAEALNHAQRAMLARDIPETGWLGWLFGPGQKRDFSHPYYWAPFTLTTTH